MPFPASSFDAVVNIESSHCYESMDAFLSEVCRVLRPGGQFFFADLRSTDGVNTLREQFNASGLTVEKETDITNQRSDRAASGQCPEAGTYRRRDPANVSPAVPCVRRHRRNKELHRVREREIALPQRTAGKEQPSNA
jgi:ubiquinone/menaquinone biosynthesis C-methylase UbiE